MAKTSNRQRPKAVDRKVVRAILERHAGEPGAVIPVLQDFQRTFGYLPRPALRIAARRLGRPVSELLGVATFYRTFSLEPRGEHTVLVCTGTACHVRGAPRLVDELCRRLDTKPGGTTADREFTLETVNCLGACALGPLIVIDGSYHGQMTPSKLDALLRQYS